MQMKMQLFKIYGMQQKYLVQKGNFVVTQAYLKTRKPVTLHQKELEKGQTKPKVNSEDQSRNKIETTKKIEKNKTAGL